MRDCYKKFWRQELVKKAHLALPNFALRESASKRAAEEAKPSAKAIEFVWNPIDKLNFILGFVAHPRQDYFEAYCKWSEIGKFKAGAAWSMTPYSDEIIAAPGAAVFVKMLSGRNGGFEPNDVIFEWKFWEPKSQIGTSPSREELQAYMMELAIEEQRLISDSEALQRVEVTVEKAITDVTRFALPWFEKKLAWYQENRK